MATSNVPAGEPAPRSALASIHRDLRPMRAWLRPPPASRDREWRWHGAFAPNPRWRSAYRQRGLWPDCEPFPRDSSPVVLSRALRNRVLPPHQSSTYNSTPHAGVLSRKILAHPPFGVPLGARASRPLLVSVFSTLRAKGRARRPRSQDLFTPSLRERVPRAGAFTNRSGRVRGFGCFGRRDSLQETRVSILSLG